MPHAHLPIVPTDRLKEVTYTFQSGDRVVTTLTGLPLSPRPEFASCGVFAFPKSGSVLVNAIVRDLMAEAGIPIVDWPQVWYAHGIDLATIQCDLEQAFPTCGYCFAGFREIPRSFLGSRVLKCLRKIMIVRDPRDMLVSRYFSTKFSHGFDPTNGTPQFSRLVYQLVDDTRMDIDSYTLFYSSIVNSDYFLYRDIIADQQTLILKYEDFIYNKRHLASAICNWVGINIPQERISSIVQPYERIPATEQPSQHVRQVHPGDYRRKLSPQTIAVLNSVLGDFMAKFGYPPE